MTPADLRAAATRLRTGTSEGVAPLTAAVLDHLAGHADVIAHAAGDDDVTGALPEPVVALVRAVLDDDAHQPCGADPVALYHARMQALRAEWEVLRHNNNEEGGGDK